MAVGAPHENIRKKRGDIGGLFVITAPNYLK
jgi:hypothetical protein